MTSILIWASLALAAPEAEPEVSKTEAPADNEAEAPAEEEADAPAEDKAEAPAEETMNAHARAAEAAREEADQPAETKETEEPAAAEQAAAEPEPPPPEPKAAKSKSSGGPDGSIVISAHFGADIPAFSPMKTFWTPGFEFGVMLPPADKLVELYVSANYAAPLTTGEGNDPGLSEGYIYDVFQKQLSAGFGARFRFREVAGPMNVTASVGPRIEMMETVTRASTASGELFGENREEYTTAGVQAALGLELPAGPGYLMAEGAFSWSPLVKVITGKSNTGRIVPRVGYRLVF